MKPVLITPLEARKLPRLLLLALCLAYIVPGLLGRDPWSGDDAIGFGIVQSWLSQSSTGDWLLPSISGLPYVAKGPLSYWFGAVFASIAAYLSPLPLTGISLRIAAGMWMALLFITLWYAAYSLARRPEVQPNDPLNAAANRIDFGRAVADSCLLILMASLGLVARIHEFSAEAFQVGLVALFLLGCAQGLRRPRWAGALAGSAIGASLLVRGLPLALPLLATLLILPLLVRQFRLVSRNFLPSALIFLIISGGAWPLALWLSADTTAQASTAHLAAWWQVNTSAFGFEPTSSFTWLGRNLAWFAWPSWPLAAWAIWRWRGKRLEPAIALPALTLLCLLVAALAGKRLGEAQMLPLLPPFAVLAAFGLPAIRRSLVAFMDWFALIVFSGFGLFVWIYWIALVTGKPEKMARSAQRFSSGLLDLSPSMPLTLGLGLVASLAWIAVIWWRITRQPRAMWRPVALSSAGMALAWFLLMTLWLPIFNYRKTYTEVAHQLAQHVVKQHQCIGTVGVSASQRALFLQGDVLRFEKVSYKSLGVSAGNQSSFANGRGINTQCDYLLLEDRINKPLTEPNAKWKPEWEGRRPSDKRERFRLYRRA